MPVAGGADEFIGRGGPPSPWCVLMEWAGRFKRRLDDAPALLDAVLAGEERLPTLDRVVEQSLVRLGLLAERRLVGERERNGPGLHRLAGHLGLEGQLDPLVAAPEPDPEVVGVRQWRALVGEQRAGRLSKLDERLEGGLLESFARP